MPHLRLFPPRLWTTLVLLLQPSTGRLASSSPSAVLKMSAPCLPSTSPLCRNQPSHRRLQPNFSHKHGAQWPSLLVRLHSISVSLTCGASFPWSCG
ncbi:hypothetical protein BC831DRAFT_449035 [Entophlyctis helioformis]|nr:hypothetical protein BC831DRAFT_449035 [Entophlyctis helioformis]